MPDVGQNGRVRAAISSLKPYFAAAIDAVAQGSTPYAGEQPFLAAIDCGAMNEPARMTSAAHAKKSAIDLPMNQCPSNYLKAGTRRFGGPQRWRCLRIAKENINS